MMNESEILKKLPALLNLNSRIAAGAGDDGILIGRMDVFFHFSLIPNYILVNQNNFVRIQI